MTIESGRDRPVLKTDKIKVTLEMVIAAQCVLSESGAIEYGDIGPDEVTISRVLKAALEAGGFSSQNLVDPGSDDQMTAKSL